MDPTETDNEQIEGGDESQIQKQPEAGTAPVEGTDAGDQGKDDGGDGAGKPEPSKAEKAFAAFEEGVAKATPGATRSATRDDEGATGASGGTGSPGPTGATAAGGTGASGASGATGAEQTDEEKTKAEKDKAINAEMDALGLRTEKTRRRFKELSERPTWEEVTEHFKPVAELAQEARTYQAILKETNANPQQVGEMFVLLGHINSGDPARIKTAVVSMQKELQWAAAKIGMRLDAFDPIDQFPDLKQDVEAGKITVERAQELMEARRAQGMTAEQRAAQQRTQQQQTDYKKKLDTAIDEIKAFDQEVRADPQYTAKKAIVAHTIERLKRTKVDPSLWPAEIKQAWSEARVAVAAAPAPTPAPAARTPSPIRPTTSGGAPMRPGVPKDPLAAFELGMEEARGSTFD